MTLAIDRFVTRCRVSPRATVDRGEIDHVVRGDFIEHCARELASIFRGHTAVIRIRRLSVRFALARRQLGEVSFAREWAAIFAASLKRTLALPEGQGSIQLKRFESRADWLAAAIEAVLQGDLTDRWEFADLPWLAAAPLPETVRRVFDSEPGYAAAILSRLQHRGRLNELLISLDQVALEDLMRRLDRELTSDPQVKIDDLLTIARWVAQHLAEFGGEHLVSRRRALALWAALAGAQMGGWTPRRVSDALFTLDMLIGVFVAQSGENVATRLLRRIDDDAVGDNARTLLGYVQRMLAASVDGDRTARDALAELTTTLMQLAQAFPSSAAAGKRIVSEVAGLLLLIPAVLRLDWSQAMQTTALWGLHGPRSLTYLLLGIGEELLRKGERGGDRIDPVVAVFAGCMGEPDLAGYGRCRDSVTPEECGQLSQALGLSLPGMPAADWPTVLSAAADRLVREFASRIRGFGKSSRAFVVQKLLAVPGEILIEERQLSVALAACPFHVALHVSSAFETVSAVGWLGFRDLVFRPGAA